MENYSIEIKRGDEILLATATESLNPKEVRKILEDFVDKTRETAEQGGEDVETALADVTARVASGENTVEDSFENIYKGFAELHPAAVIEEVRQHLSRLAAISDIQIGVVSLRSKSAGMLGFTVLFDQEIDDEGVSAFVNGAAGHVDVMRAELGKKYKLVSQDDNGGLILPGRFNGAGK